MLAQLPEDLVHLEGGGERLDEHGGLDRPARDGEPLLRGHEDVVPQPRLEVGLQLGQVEVGPGAPLPQRLRVVEEVEGEVEEGGGNRLPVVLDVPLRQVQPARPDEEDRGLLAEAVLLAGVRSLVRDRAPDRVHEVLVAEDHVVPGGRVRVLEVGHEDAGAGVERVDDHLPLDGAGDLDAPVLEVGGQGRHRPARLAHGARLGQEVRALARIETELAIAAALQELVAPPGEVAHERAHEIEGVGGEDGLVVGAHGAPHQKPANGAGCDVHPSAPSCGVPSLEARRPSMDSPEGGRSQ